MFSNSIGISHNGTDITSLVLAESFPDSLRKSVKGNGYFDFEVRSFSFKVLKGDLLFAREDRIEIVDPTSGDVLLKGFIDEIKGEYKDDPEITIFPDVLLLKDVQVGEEEEDSNGETNRHYSFTGSIFEIISSIINEVNLKKGTDFNADEVSIPDTEGSEKKFFGSIIEKISKKTLPYQVIKYLFGDYGDGYSFRRKDGISYLVKKDAGFFFKTIISKGSFLDYSYSWGFDLGILGSYGFAFDFEVPWFDFKFPTLGIKYYIFKCEYGGLTFLEEIDFFPFAPFWDSAPNLSDPYGESIDTMTTDNVNINKVESFLKEEGYDWDTLIVLGMIDADSSNSYVLADCKRGNSNLIDLMVISFETPFDNSYSVEYKNESASKIIKDLAIVGNRWLYLDENNKVYMIPRDDGLGSIDVDSRTLLSWEKDHKKEEDVEVSVSQLKRDGNNKITSYGIKLRDNELNAIKNHYKKVFEGTRYKTEIEILNPGDISLLKTISINGTEVGRVIECSQSFLEDKAGIICETGTNYNI